MTNKKSAPLTPEESNKRDKQILDSLSEASMIDLANSILAEWKPYLNSEGETILGQEVHSIELSYCNFKGQYLQEKTPIENY